MNREKNESTDVIGSLFPMQNVYIMGFLDFLVKIIYDFIQPLTANGANQMKNVSIHI